MKQNFFSHGKLLLTGEYLVLDGALSLALPTNRGQEMLVDLLPGSGNIHWTAKNHEGSIWINVSFILQNEHLIPVSMGTLETAPEVNILKQLLENALLLNSRFLNNQTDYEVICNLQFPSDWGLGSSSTLLTNVAKWAGVDVMELFSKSWEGSGYDVAVAIESQSILYQIIDHKPVWEVVQYNPPFSNELYFVHLGNKQNSRKEIESYRQKIKPENHTIEKINRLTQAVFECKELSEFEKLLSEHESILSKILLLKPVKERLFSDFEGAIKSLGAWGGDFIIATGSRSKSYFAKKGYSTILTWDEMIIV